MLDLVREQPVTLAAVPMLIPAINAVPGMDARKPLHPKTISNWATRGKRGVVLETVPIGGLLVTTREAVQRFFGRLAELREDKHCTAAVPVSRRPRTTKHAQASMEETIREHFN